MRFDFAYGRLTPLMVAVGLAKTRSWIEVGSDTVTVKMGWAFHATIPRNAITDVKLLDTNVISIGVHGRAGRWLVNGAGDRLIALTIDPEIKARSVIPVRLRELTMSVEDRDGLAAELATPPAS